MTYTLVNWYTSALSKRWTLEKLYNTSTEFIPQQDFIIITEEEYELFESNMWIFEL